MPRCCHMAVLSMKLQGQRVLSGGKKVCGQKTRVQTGPRVYVEVTAPPETGIQASQPSDKGPNLTLLKSQ